MTPEEINEALEKLRDLVNTSQYKVAKAFAYELLENQTIQKDDDSLTKIYTYLGNTFTSLSDFSQALEQLIRAKQIYTKKDNKAGICGTLVNIGLVYHSISDHEQALHHYEQALVISEEIDHKIFQSAASANIGEVYRSLFDFSKALEYFQMSLRINEQLGNTDVIARILGNIGSVYGSLSDYTTALEYFFKSVQIIEKIGNKEVLAINLVNIGNVFKELSDFKKALEYYNRALFICEEIGNTYGIISNLVNIGQIHATRDSNFYDEKIAEEYLQKTLILSNEINVKEITKEALNNLHTLRLNQRQFEEALQYYKQSVEIEKQIQSEEATNKAQQFDQRRKLEEDEKARQLKLARFQEQEKILHNILPVKIAERILLQETFIADHFDSVSVMFMDIVGFTSLSSIAPPKQLVFLLDTIFTKADEIVESFGMEKIKTIGDGYLAVANVTSPLEHHQKSTALAALQLLETMKDYEVNIPTNLGDTNWIKDMNDLEIRIGIHTGEVVAGIIGKNKYTYDLWGDAVNVASRMESNSEAGRIHISEAFAKSIEHYPEFRIIPRGEISIKGKGMMQTFWLEKT